MGHSVDYFGFAFALLIVFGGILGFARKGSLPSLVMGLVAGVVLGVAARQVSENPRNATLGAVVCSTLALIMGYRFYQSGNFMPGGLVAGLSVAMAGRYLLKMYSS